MVMMQGFFNFFFGFIFVISALAVVFDMRHYSDNVWERAKEPKNVWFVVGTVAGWPFGMLVYLFVIRPKLEAIYSGDNHEALKAKLFEEWRAEQAAQSTGADGNVTTAVPQGSSAQVSSASE